ncbi:glycosyltransferase family 4 protein [Piscinibacter sp.]|jgi:glycosyltransferase involved in cell wall biosynthesis|uniref:glycosyltransferase family 4 protein n=1 Tax=Piscinibacter sp. TaxID=1903157 RepID=UPI002F409A50
MKIAIVHEWLDTFAGSERVLEQMLEVFKQADLFAVVDFVPPQERGFLGGRTPKTTFIQRLPWARKYFRNYLPLMPLAVEQIDLRGYDLVISSNHAVAKGVITGPHQLHVSYVHSPMRYAWDLQHQYLAESGLDRGLKSAIARTMLHYLRSWDQRSANGVDRFVANSQFIARRIRKVYRRDAHVIHPPVDIDRFALRHDKEDFYLSASRLVPYKRVPLVVEAFAGMPDKRLLVVGDGPDLARIRKSLPPNVTLLGYQPIERLVDTMQRARALVFAAEEDFGIAPVEVQACGTPVIAFGRGGSLETVVAHGPMRTGLLFMEQTAESIRDAVHRFEAEADSFSASACRAHAERFSVPAFRDSLASFVNDEWRRFHAPLSVVEGPSKVVHHHPR